MQAPIMIKPQRRKYLLFYAGIAALGSIVTLLSSSLIYRNISLAYGTIAGLWSGVLLIWSYDAITKFRRFTLIVTDSYVQIPFNRGIRLLSEATLDKARTVSYRSKKNLDNWLSYSFWLVNGERCYISKLLYVPSEIDVVLEKLGCLRSSNPTSHPT